MLGDSQIKGKRALLGLLYCDSCEEKELADKEGYLGFVNLFQARSDQIALMRRASMSWLWRVC